MHALSCARVIPHHCASDGHEARGSMCAHAHGPGTSGVKQMGARRAECGVMRKVSLDDRRWSGDTGERRVTLHCKKIKLVTEQVTTERLVCQSRVQ